MSRIAGIDLRSACIDIVLLDEDRDEATWHRFSLSGRTPFERAHDVRLHLPSPMFWADRRVSLIAIEEPRGHRNPVTLLALGSLYGAIVSRLPRDIPALALTPSDWKRPLTGNGMASKQQVKARCVELGFGDAPDLPSDYYDALGLAWSARELAGRALERGAA